MLGLSIADPNGMAVETISATDDVSDLMGAGYCGNYLYSYQKTNAADVFLLTSPEFEIVGNQIQLFSSDPNDITLLQPNPIQLDIIVTLENNPSIQ